MTAPKFLTMIAILLLGCGDTEPEAEPDIMAIGGPIYELQGGWNPFTHTLYTDNFETLQLVRSDNRLEVIAELTPESKAVLTQAMAALGSGDTDIGQFDPACLGFHDASQVTLYVSKSPSYLSFSYPWGCPPSGLANIDEILRDTLDAMIGCTPSPYLESCDPITGP